MLIENEKKNKWNEREKNITCKHKKRDKTMQVCTKIVGNVVNSGE